MGPTAEAIPTAKEHHAAIEGTIATANHNHRMDSRR